MSTHSPPILILFPLAPCDSPGLSLICLSPVSLLLVSLSFLFLSLSVTLSFLFLSRCRFSLRLLFQSFSCFSLSPSLSLSLCLSPVPPSLHPAGEILSGFSSQPVTVGNFVPCRSAGRCCCSTCSPVNSPPGALLGHVPRTCTLSTHVQQHTVFITWSPRHALDITPEHVGGVALTADVGVL